MTSKKWPFWVLQEAFYSHHNPSKPKTFLAQREVLPIIWFPADAAVGAQAAILQAKATMPMDIKADTAIILTAIKAIAQAAAE